MYSLNYLIKSRHSDFSSRVGLKTFAIGQLLNHRPRFFEQLCCDCVAGTRPTHQRARRLRLLLSLLFYYYYWKPATPEACQPGSQPLERGATNRYNNIWHLRTNSKVARIKDFYLPSVVVAVAVAEATCVLSTHSPTLIGSFRPASPTRSAALGPNQVLNLLFMQN